jgi:hypothetical protein
MLQVIVLLLLLATSCVCVQVVYKAIATKRGREVYALPMTICLFTFAYVVLGLAGEMVLFNRAERPYGVPLETIAVGLVMHLLFLVMWIAGYWSRAAQYFCHDKRFCIRRISFSKTHPVSVITMVVLTGIFVYAYATTGALYNTDMSENALQMAGAPSTRYQALTSMGGFATPLITAFLATSIASGKKLAVSLYVPLFLVLVAVGATGGNRAAVVFPLVQMTLVFYLCRRDSLSLSMFVVTAAVLLMTSTLLLQYRSGAGARQDGIMKRMASLLESGGHGSSVGGYLLSGFEQVLGRGDVIANTGFIYEWLHDTHAYVYFRPYEGVVFSYVPRAVWPNKPYAGSIDGSAAGVCSIAIYELRYGHATGCLTTGGALRTYWQFGWLGILAGGYVAGIMLRSLSEWTLSGGDIGLLAFLILIQRLGFCVAESPEVIMIAMLRVFVPLLCVSCALMRVARRMPGFLS